MSAMPTKAALNFRRATAEDAANLETLINTAFCDDQTTEVFTSTNHALLDIVSAATLVNTISKPDVTVLVATDPKDGALVGHCSLRMMEDGVTAWFGLLAVDVACKNRGLGSQVLAYAEQYARQELGAKRMAFNVVNTRAGLISWYTRRGYQPTGETEPFPYDSHDDARELLRNDLEFLLFTKTLSEASTASTAV
ncbi:hypothetical protein N0V93_003013 [Gnomoniopsis smithogilvyi]|uniref:N-acetyltransferase domain-containing protein n=1 Tax=Gnomoniopsis smithogilvyi TaxID=1191159 RepID=A0A9W8YYJ8_9PEZI|nr:hypothetical protein N0V93_003013 [Gnomoniopsis smithogilvyi]